MVQHALTWADKLIVLDNGSNDGTWEQLQDLQNDRVILIGPVFAPYTDGLRGIIFNKLKHELGQDDWWVIQDSDEFYDVSPRDFVENISTDYHYVASKKIDFQLTIEDIKQIDFTNNFKADIGKIKYYQPWAWSEPRMIRHRARLRWPNGSIWPTHMGLVFPRQIPVRHYPHRSPQQMLKRLETRAEVKKTGGQFFRQWDKQDWEAYLLPRENLYYDNGTADIFANVQTRNNPFQSAGVRFIKKIMHQIGIWP